MTRKDPSQSSSLRASIYARLPKHLCHAWPVHLTFFSLVWILHYSWQAAIRVDDGFVAESPDVGEGLLLRGLVPASSIQSAEAASSDRWRAWN